MKQLEIITVFLVFTTALAITNTKDKEQNVQNNEVVKGRTGKIGGKGESASESQQKKSFSSVPFHRTSFLARHGGLGIGLGVGLSPSRSAGYGPPDAPNFSSSGYGHGGAGVHVSGNGYSYGRPGEEYPPSPAPFDHRGAGPLPGAYDGGTYGGAYPHGSFDDGGLIYAGHTGGHGHGHGHGPGGQYGPPGPPSGHGGPGIFGGHGSPGIFGGHHLGPHHKIALKSILIPLAGVAILGAAAALSSANPILLQLGVAGKRRRRALFHRRHLYPSNPYVKAN